jgi:O-antigen/teichoic acid export membrane protein
MSRVPLYQWIKANSVILLNAGSLIGTTAVTSMLGLAYWWFAARQFTPEAVGLASAILSVMTLLGTFCILGLGTLLIGELSRQPGQEASLISAALVLVGGVGGCIGILFALVAPFISLDFQSLRASIQDVALFAIGISLTAVTLVLDQALIGLLRGGLQLWRNALFAVAKLVALLIAGFWLSHDAGLTIYGTWAIGNMCSLAALAGYWVWKGGWSGKSFWPNWELLRKLKSAALQHHLLNLVLQAPGLLLPVVVTVMLSATMNAWFYVSSMISNFVSVGTLALTTVLYAANAAQPAALARKIRLTLSLSFVLCVLANLILQSGTKQVLGIFGSTYAEQAAWSMRVLVIGAFPLIIKDHYIAVRRIQSQVARAMLPLIAGGFLELAGAALGARFAGLLGLSLGWLAAVLVEAACMFAPVYKAVRSTETSSQSAGEAYDEEADADWLVDTLVLPPSVKLLYLRTKRDTDKQQIPQNGNTPYIDEDTERRRVVRPQPLMSYQNNVSIQQNGNTTCCDDEITEPRRVVRPKTTAGGGACAS